MLLELGRHEECRTLGDDAGGQHDAERDDVHDDFDDLDGDVEAALIGCRAGVVVRGDDPEHVPLLHLGHHAAPAAAQANSSVRHSPDSGGHRTGSFHTPEAVTVQAKHLLNMLNVRLTLYP